MTKPSSYKLKTDWACDNLRVCKSCLYFEDLCDEVGCESCTHPDHYWQGTYTDGPEWNGTCAEWEEE